MDKYKYGWYVQIYSKSAVLVWDPSAYNSSTEDWYNKPDWPFFEQFFSKRLMQPEDSMYLLNPGKHKFSPPPV